MPSDTIRVIALCAIFRRDDLFVRACRGGAIGERRYRLPGGDITFGETGKAAVARALRAEIGAEIVNIYRIETLEHLFTCEGRPGHEIVQVYTAQFANDALYEMDFVVGQEGDNPAQYVWMPLAAFAEGREALDPAGLLALLQEWRDMLGALGGNG